MKAIPGTHLGTGSVFPKSNTIFTSLPRLRFTAKACVFLMIAVAKSDWPQLARDAQRRAEMEVTEVSGGVSLQDS